MSSAATLKLQELNKTIGRIIQDDAGILKGEEIDNYILLALNFHNKIRPREVVEDIAGDGEYDYALPATYIDKLSTILSIEFPAGDRNPTYLESKHWIIYKTASTTKLRFLEHTPSSSQTVRLVLTTPYDKANLDNIPINDQEPFCYLAASLAAKSLSMYYAQSSDDTVDASTVDYGELSEKYATRARELGNVYNTFFGVKDGVAAAMGFLDWDTNFTWGEEQFTKEDYSN